MRFIADEGLPTGKPKPILVPDGIHSNNFELFVTCTAARADRVGRDLPLPEYVKKVEDEVRMFLYKAESPELVPHLEHLAFLL